MKRVILNKLKTWQSFNENVSNKEMVYDQDRKDLIGGANPIIADLVNVAALHNRDIKHLKTGKMLGKVQFLSKYNSKNVSVNNILDTCYDIAKQGKLSIEYSYDREVYVELVEIFGRNQVMKQNDTMLLTW
jgi:hypothetical protein